MNETAIKIDDVSIAVVNKHVATHTLKDAVIYHSKQRKIKKVLLDRINLEISKGDCTIFPST